MNLPIYATDRSTAASLQTDADREATEILTALSALDWMALDAALDAVSGVPVAILDPEMNETQRMTVQPLTPQEERHMEHDERLRLVEADEWCDDPTKAD